MADLRSGLDPSDYRYIVDVPNPEFSPERNKAIIAETIKDAESYQRMLLEADSNEMGHKIDILASYGTYRFNKGTKKLKDYLGPEQYKAVIGEKILSKLRIAEATNRMNGNTRLKKGILL